MRTVMTRTKATNQGSLFDGLPEPETLPRFAPLMNQKDCPHVEWRPSETVWPGETFSRLTSTCTLCEYVRGRWPGEFAHRPRAALSVRR